MTTSPSEKRIQIKDDRERDFYIAQRDLVRRAGKFIGPYGCAVYNSLLSHADEDKECWPGLSTIAEEFGMSKMQAIRSINLLTKYRMVRVSREKGKPNKYHLMDAKKWELPEVVTDSDQLNKQPVTDSDQLGCGVVTDSDQLTAKVVTDSDPKYIKESKKESISRVSDFSDGEKPPKKNIGPQINYLEEIPKALSVFDQETKIAVQLFCVAIASQNKSGEMSQGRYLNTLCDLAALSKTAPVEIFREAVRKATANKAHTVNYIKAILKAKTNDTPAQAAAQGELPTPRAKPKITYEIGKSGVWYRVEGTERTPVNEEDVPENVLRKYHGDPPPVNGPSAVQIVDALARAMAMNKGNQEALHV